MSTKKNDILVTANKLFNEFGFISVGVDRIVEESNVAKMTFYKYFPSKDDLIKETLIQRHQYIQMNIEQALQDSESDSLSQLKSLFDWYQNWFEQNNFFGCMFVKAADELTSNKEIETIIIKHKLWLTKKLEEILMKSSIENITQVTRQIRLLLDGAIINEKVFQDGSSISDAWQVTCHIIEYSKIN